MTGRKYRFRIVLMLFLLLPAGGICLSSIPANADRIHDASWRKTVDLYMEIPCLTEEQKQYGQEIITGLSYNAKRIFRQMSLMPGIDFELSKKAWMLLLELDLSYEQVLSFENWSRLDDITAELALTALPEIKKLNYEACKAFSRYCDLPRITAEHALNTIPLLNRFDDAQNRAAQSFFSIGGINALQALEGLETIARLQVNQSRAAAAFASIHAMDAQTMLDGLPLLFQLHQDDAWNARTLFSCESMTPAEAWFWLTGYFATPSPVQNKQFYLLSAEKKHTLLKAFYDGGVELIWKINNLHAVTDRFGFEISNHELNGYSPKQLEQRFTELSPQITVRHADRYYATSDKNERIRILKTATAQERVETGRRMTSANIYALLAQGSELYDSSFRNVLVPILQKRIEVGFSGNLLRFLEAVDSANLFISDFIVSLAQKGKLTTFFPENPREQEQILDLVAVSAFQDEDSIILFSATFMYLLEVLQPSARSFLIEKMSRQAESRSNTYARLITVILQYYLQEYPELLGEDDRQAITRLIDQNGMTDLSRYLKTPFSQWKSDGNLSSISVFHPDDDGRDSFRSYIGMLLQSGYNIKLSEQFSLFSMSEEPQEDIRLIIDQAAKKSSGSALSSLFSSMYRNRYAVALVKDVNGLTINHAVLVYTGEKDQELLIERFFRTGTEMFAQRGHSYWRSEQITDPMQLLMDKGKLTQTDLFAHQRFLSLGSCGGVKAYTKLDRMFAGNVDILATIGTGLAAINDPYNKNFFEVVARKPSSITWKDVARELSFIFQGGQGRDYLQPGSLPAILHKIINEERKAPTENQSG